MTDETVADAAEAPPNKAKRARKKKVKAAPKGERGQSTIAFPYQDLDNGISVVRAILGAGGVAVTRDQLAGVMNLSASSGNFVLKVATARMFGLINNVGGKYEMSPLGFDIVDPGRQRGARATAFLTVPLYKRVYDEFRGRQLPPRPHGLENAFLKFGVAPKQCATARLVFDKSAAQAGFFSGGPERLIEPIIGGGASTLSASELEESDVAEVPERPAARAIPERTGPTLHPFIQGLLDTLPEANTNWAVEGRAKWLQAAAHCFDLIYMGDGAVTISVAKPAPVQTPAPAAPARQQAIPVGPRQAIPVPPYQAISTETRPPTKAVTDDDIPF